MARGKNSAKAPKDGKHRKETKEEKALRLKTQQEARELCLKWTPYALGALFVFLVMFAMYVRSIPPKEIIIPNATIPFDPANPPFMAEATGGAAENAKDIPKKTEESETVEL